jgi:hypothetical protein
MRSRRPDLSLIALALAVSLAACGTADPPGEALCPGPRPAFALLVEAADKRPLPEDTTILVVYGGSAEERFHLKAPSGTPDVVFCGVVPGGADPDGGVIDAGQGGPTEVTAVSCQLWTDGAANVTVQAEGLATVKRTLEAKTDRCGITTTPTTISLVPPGEKDGGS